MCIRDRVCVPVFEDKDSNSSKSPIGINDLDLYKRIWFLALRTSTKYDPSTKPGIKVPWAVYVISSPVMKLTFDGKDITLYFNVLGLYPCKSIFPVAFGRIDWGIDAVIV